MPLLWLSTAFVCGVLLGAGLRWPLGFWMILAACMILAALYFRAPRIALTTTWLPVAPLPYPVLVAALAFGGARYQSIQTQITPTSVAWYNDQDTTFILEGMLLAPPDEREDYTALRVQVTQFRPTSESVFQPIEGVILARVPVGGGWRYGDQVRLSGILETPFANDEFSYRDYLSRQGIYSIFACSKCMACAARVKEDCILLLKRGAGNPLWNSLYSLRSHTLKTIYTVFPDPEASLLAGILVGEERGIPANLQHAFQNTGVAHIIAISGFNFTLIAGLFAWVFNRLLGRWRGALAALLSIAIYAVLVGASAGVVRAALMSGLSLIAQRLGRRQSGLNSLAAVAAAMAFLDPNVLWDVSFQLSFTATLGLILYADSFQQAFTRWLEATSLAATPTLVERLSGPVGEYFLFTLAAQITTLPVTIYHFQRLSLISLLANPLILPAQPPIMLLGGIALFAGWVSQPIGELAAALCWPFLAYTTRMVEALNGLNIGMIVLGQASLTSVALFYAILFGWTYGRTKIKTWLAHPNLKQRLSQAAAKLIPFLTWLRSNLTFPTLIVLGAATIVVWQMTLTTADGRLHVTLLDVGSGDALLIQTPSGRSVLVDGGPSATRLADGLGRRLPFFHRRLDYLVIAATGEAQVNGLINTIERFPPTQVLWAGPQQGDYSARQLQKLLIQLSIPLTYAQTGQALDLGQGARLSVLAVTPRGAVLLLEWKSFRLLLPVGLDFEALETLQNDPLQAPMTALLLAESGYAPLNPPQWIARWQPQLILLSVEAGDQNGLPAPEVLEAIQSYTTLRTDRNGWIQLSTNGEQLWMEVERK